MLLQINPKFKQSELEAQVLKFWADNNTFTKLLNQTANGVPWYMIDGPVTANNRLGVHHGWGRTYKDIFQRFNAMQGRRCLWQNGFDCQGLWVEVEVEKELGISGPREIEGMGVERFAAECRSRVDRFAQVIIDQSKLLGQWADWPNSYRTDSNNNILHIWGFLKKCREKNLIQQGVRVMPWCTRCGTSLSQHEMADSYEEKTEPAIDFLCPSRANPKQAFMAWTTTPWTVPANTALAVHPDMDYVLMGTSSHDVWMSKVCKDRAMSEIPVKDTKKGSELVGLAYNPPYRLPGVEYKIVPWEGVEKDIGSGFVHIAPAFGADDYALWKKLSLDGQEPRPHQFHLFEPVGENGVYDATVKQFAGKHWQKVNQEVIADLGHRQLLVAAQKHTHRYPHCWRCKEPVIFRLCKEWFILVSNIREELLAAAAKIEWKPAHVGLHMKNWLENMGDWCISRRRFWGLPLPFYQCGECHYVTVVGSTEDLQAKTTTLMPELWKLKDLHKPHIDQHQMKCDHCGKPVSRIKEVGDCWLDAGIVPFSTFNYDLTGRHPNYPFDFAVEMREQVRLWFYSTLVMGVVMEGEAPFKTVMTYDEMRDDKGQKFSKTKGNAPSLDKIVGEYGADVLRYAVASAPTDEIFQFSDAALKKAKKTFNTLWNCVAYFAQYANADKPDVMGVFEASEPLDWWLVNRLSQYVTDTTKHLDAHNAQQAIYAFNDFVDDLSTWYIRIKRPVFAGPNCEAKTNAYRILYTALRTMTITMAPLFPFTAEELYQKLVRHYEPGMPESVHLNPFPKPCLTEPDDTIIDKMADVRDVVQIALSIRNGAKYKVRQPLRKAIIENWPTAEKWQREMVGQEVNVLKVVTDEGIPDGAFKVTCHEMIVYVNLDLDDELKELGAVREMIRFIQDKRKDMGLVVGDRIAMFGVAENAIWDVIQKHLGEILKKTNASMLTRFDGFENGENFIEVDLGVLGGSVKLVAVKTKAV